MSENGYHESSNNGCESNYIFKRKAENDNYSLEEDEEEISPIVREKRIINDMKNIRENLPIYRFREDLILAILKFQILIIVAETGSGKTTQIPQYLIENGLLKKDMKIACTQPRRVAAMSVAKRVSDEMRVNLGSEVGYSVRFDDKSSKKTILKYMTDGMLLREFLLDPFLSSYSFLMIDEAHERTLHTDILFGLVKDLCFNRPDFKIIISSATLDAQKFSSYFNDAPIFNVPGRRFPVDIFYCKNPEHDYIAATIKTCIQIHQTPEEGDILVFLTGQEEIELVKNNLEKFHCSVPESAKDNGYKNLIITPIYSSLPIELQSNIFTPTPKGYRKIVLATNIAETSLTIDGILFVVDCGFVKQNSFDPRTGMDSLTVVPCSKASVNQRSGRAGRIGRGKCYRLFTSWAYENELDDNTTPEIQRTNLGNVVLLLKSLGVDDLLNFDFMDAPSKRSLIKALEELFALGALNAKGNLSVVGNLMSEYPVDPQISKSIISAIEYNCVNEVIIIMSMLSVQRDLFYFPSDRKEQAEACRKSFFTPEGDHIMLLNIWNKCKNSIFSYSWCNSHYIQVKSIKRARSIYNQLLSIFKRQNPKYSTSYNDNPVFIKKAILSGFFMKVAQIQRNGESYQTVKSRQSIFTHPSSSLFEKHPSWVVYHELVLTTKEYMRQISNIEPEWLLEVAPHYFTEGELQSTFSKKRN